MAQVVEHLPSKYEAWSSNRERERNEGKGRGRKEGRNVIDKGKIL
jgi:hypothetical protein